MTWGVPVGGSAYETDPPTAEDWRQVAQSIPSERRVLMAVDSSVRDAVFGPPERGGKGLVTEAGSQRACSVLTLEAVFPPFALRISCGPLELRVLRDDDLPELVDLVRGGIQAPDAPMPFLQAWHEEPFAPGSPDGFPATSLGWWWTQRAAFAPEEWRLALVVRRDGVMVGIQDMHAQDFPQRRHVLTGSWLGRAHQGQGTGTLMRQLVVGFAFDELGAKHCESAYILGNHASAAVSRKVGYVDNGRRRIVQQTRQGKVGVDEQGVLVTPTTFIRPAEPVSVDGADALRRFLSIDRHP